jgi:hypothetical protein
MRRDDIVLSAHLEQHSDINGASSLDDVSWLSPKNTIDSNGLPTSTRPG